MHHRLRSPHASCSTHTGRLQRREGTEKHGFSNQYLDRKNKQQNLLCDQEIPRGQSAFLTAAWDPKVEAKHAALKELQHALRVPA